MEQVCELHSSPTFTATTRDYWQFWQTLSSSNATVLCVWEIYGYSRGGDNWLRYAIYDSERDSIMFRVPEGPILVF